MVTNHIGSARYGGEGSKVLKKSVDDDEEAKTALEYVKLYMKGSGDGDVIGKVVG